MNRLQLELDRLYGPGPHAAEAPHALRALVLELALPAGWTELYPAWMGVQSELGLPAPAIAVSGFDSLQLWFSLASPILQADGARFLEGVRTRYLAQVKTSQVRLVAAADAFSRAPPVERSPARWSAFVSPDLASVFSDTPWLDVPPTEDGQATLLRSLEPIRRPAFEAALRQLDGRAEAAPREPALPAAEAVRPPEHEAADPLRFLAGVMADETVPLALRIEAAKALLPYSGRS